MNHNSILKELKIHLMKNYSSVVKDVILFGSHAKGTASSDSDYDVLIVLDNEYDWRDENKILDLCYDIDLKYNILIDAHIISNQELKSARGRQPIFVNAIKTGLYV